MPNTKEKGKLIEVLSKHIPYGYATLCLIADELMADGVRLEEKRATSDGCITKAVREKLVELIENAESQRLSVALCCTTDELIDLPSKEEYIAESLVANGVTVQDDMTELIGRGLDNIYLRIYGTNKEFNERMAGYNPSSFCAGFQYAIQLAKGLLTQLPQPPKGE